MSATDYRDLIDWKKAFELAVEIYRETAKYPVEEKIWVEIPTPERKRIGTLQYCGGRRKKFKGIPPLPLDRTGIFE